MRSLTQVRRLQLENGWTLTAPNGHAVEYVRRHSHDNRPFTTNTERFTAQQVTAAPPADEPLTVAVTMWRHTPMYHVAVANGIATCGRDELEVSAIGLSDVPNDSVCPICRPHTGIPRPPRPERRWIYIPSYQDWHVLVGERSTACAMWCPPERYPEIADYPVAADSDLKDGARCEVCVANQDADDRRDSWRYL